MLQILQRAIADIGAAFKLRGAWMALASEDIADSHRATLLGPVWPLLNYLLFAGTFVFIFRGHRCWRQFRGIRRCRIPSVAVHKRHA